MKISVVMAVYNGVHFLKEQLDSLKNQSYQIDEAIIIDDCSSDSSYDLIEQYINRYQLDKWKIIKNDKNIGYRANFKKGLEISTGDIVFLCDQDDRWHLDKIETMVGYMHQEVLTLASSFNFMDQDGKCFKVDKIKGRSNNNLLFQEVKDILTLIPLSSLLEMNFSQGCTMAIKREVINIYLEKTTGLLPHDWELNMISSIKDGCYYLDLPLIDYRIHNHNTIGLSNITDDSYLEEKKKRVNQRIGQTKKQVNNVAFALTLDLDRKQKEYCLGYQDYLSYRIKAMENKKAMALVKYYITGKYKIYGHFKTFMGDLMNVIK